MQEPAARTRCSCLLPPIRLTKHSPAAMHSKRVYHGFRKFVQHNRCPIPHRGTFEAHVSEYLLQVQLYRPNACIPILRESLILAICHSTAHTTEDLDIEAHYQPLGSELPAATLYVTCQDGAPQCRDDAI